MAKIKIIQALIILQVFIFNFSKGQQLTSYNLQFLPQRSYFNPSFFSSEKINVGIPVLSGISNTYSNNAFRYNDLYKKTSGGNLEINIDAAIENLHSRNTIHWNIETELLSVGFKAGKNHITINATEKGDINFDFSRSCMKFLAEGNASTIGTTQQINPGLEAIHYREYGLGWAREISKSINAGIRLKYLYGMEHILTSGPGISVYTDPIDYTLTAAGSYTIYTSGLDTSAFNNFNFENYMIGRKNTGYAVDAGISVTPVPSIEITASVIDIGRMKWTSNNAIYHTITASEGFVYTGINLDEFINNDSTSGETFIQSLGDSIYNSFNVQTTTGSYNYTLPAQFFFSTAYILNPAIKITALIHHKSYVHSKQTDYQLSLSGKSKSWLNYSISLNKLNKTSITPGAGIVLNFGKDQLYFASDNIPGMFSWKNSYNTGFRAGINIILGREKKETTPPQPTFEEPIAEHQ